VFLCLAFSRIETRNPLVTGSRRRLYVNMRIYEIKQNSKKKSKELNEYCIKMASLDFCSVFYLDPNNTTL
jgi:hypothetical protein